MQKDLDIATIFLIGGSLDKCVLNIPVGGINVLPYEALDEIKNIYWDLIVLAFRPFQYDEFVFEDLNFLNIPKEKILLISAYYVNMGTSYNERWDIIKNNNVANIDDYPVMWDGLEYKQTLKQRAKNYSMMKKLKKKNYPKTVEENKKILKDYIFLCEEKGVVPIGVFYPMSEIAHKFFKGRVLDEYYSIISEFLKTMSLTFLNLFKLEGYVLDDFSDAMHMNLNGAKKTSAYINNYLIELERQRE